MGDEVVVGMEGGRPRWVSINGTKIHGVADMQFTLEANQPGTRIQIEMIAKDVRVVPANIDDPEFDEIRKALKL